MADETYPKREYGTYEINENLSLKENLAAAKAAGALILKADLDRYEEWIAKLDARKPTLDDISDLPSTGSQLLKKGSISGMRDYLQALRDSAFSDHVKEFDALAARVQALEDAAK